MGFGEPFLVEHASRSAFVRADCPATCWVLSRADFERLSAASPEVALKLLKNLLVSSSSIIDRLSHEVLADTM
jgi:CRP-like cAMP-binding protein